MFLTKLCSFVPLMIFSLFLTKVLGLFTGHHNEAGNYHALISIADSIDYALWYARAIPQGIDQPSKTILKFHNSVLLDEHSS